MEHTKPTALCLAGERHPIKVGVLSFFDPFLSLVGQNLPFLFPRCTQYLLVLGAQFTFSTKSIPLLKTILPLSV